MSQIHPTATISPDAIIGKNVEIGPYAMIGPRVQIGDGCFIHHNVTLNGNTTLGEKVEIGAYSVIGDPCRILDFQEGKIDLMDGQVRIGNGSVLESNVMIKGFTTMGEGNLIGSYTTIGFPPQAKRGSTKPTYVEIGNHNQLREYVSIQSGTVDGSGHTIIGNYNLIMVYAHLAHDTKIGDYCALSNSTNLAGHVEFGSYVVTGGFACFHQYTRVGDYAMAGGMSGVYQDLAPYMLATGHRASLYGINLVGLQRNGFTSEEIQQAQQIYNIFFQSNLAPVIARREVQNKVPDGPVLRRFVEFIEKSRRGLVTREVG
ncbi:MAG: acyl-ACP--UDP-N-acetylglucosamine O-acyltransferase [SAR324 cluster bacterium]|nr:acyl-ACP--UDP-N-acetylglucosamine O-acyltransferase [SAR324 cluster bacterium]